MTAFSEAEIEYLTGERRLGRLATVEKDGLPHVVPVGMWHYNSEMASTIGHGPRARASDRSSRRGVGSAYPHRAGQGRFVGPGNELKLPIRSDDPYAPLRESRLRIGMSTTASLYPRIMRKDSFSGIRSP